MLFSSNNSWTGVTAKSNFYPQTSGCDIKKSAQDYPNDMPQISYSTNEQART